MGTYVTPDFDHYLYANWFDYFLTKVRNERKSQMDEIDKKDLKKKNQPFFPDELKEMAEIELSVDDDIINRFEGRMENHDVRIDPIVKGKEKDEKDLKKMEETGEIPDAEIAQRIDYQIGVDPTGMVLVRFLANKKPLKVSTLSFDTAGAMALANNLVKVVRSYQKTQVPQTPTATPV